MKAKSCPACCNLFLAKSELGDRRPVVACDSGDAICADCFNERRRSSPAKCPVCEDDLMSAMTVNTALMEMIESYASVLEISIDQMEVDKKAVAHDEYKIYNAKWRKRDVIIKVVRSDNEKQKKESSYEANLVIGLLHPNVVRLFGTTRMNKNFGIVMEKAVHGCLDAWIGKIAQEKAVRIALGIVNGLDYLHSRKVVHRDIKPTTILMCGPHDNMIPKIGDFSRSKIIQSVSAHTQIDNDYYTAPEVGLCLKYGFTADVFSLATTLFELFNGKLIKDAPTDIKRIIFAVKAGRVGTIPDRCAVPPGVRRIIQCGWDKNPEERPKLDEYRSALKPMITKPALMPRPMIRKSLSRSVQAAEMADINIAVPAQAMSWSASCENANSKQLRLKMVDDIKTKSTLASLINESVFSALLVVPRHLFVEKRKLVGQRSSQQEVVNLAYTFNKPIPTTINSNESSPEIIGTQLSMTEIIQGQSVLLVGIKGGYMQAVIAQLVGINGSVESVTTDDAALEICRDRIETHCPLSNNIDWIKVSNIKDCGSVAAEFKRQGKLFHTIIFGFVVERFPFELTEKAGLLYSDGNVSILAPVRESGVVRFQLYLRRGNENDAELRKISDFDSVSEDAY